MDTEKCAALLKALELGSLSGAAEALGYTPSGISRMMASLEEETGVALLCRGRNGVAPTEACRTLLPTIRELVRLGERCAQEAASIRGLETGTVRIGCVYGIYYDWVARTVAAFSTVYPGIEVQLLQDSSAALAAAMERHEADLCLMSFREGAFEFVTLQEDPLVAWVPKDHPRVADGIYPLRDFERDPYIDTYPGDETDNARAFALHGIRPNIRYTTIDTHATASLVSSGLGVSLNNTVLAYGHDLSGIVLLPTEPECLVPLGIAVVKKESRSPAAERFLSFARERLPELRAATAE